jgi:hypothetical protein
VLPGGVVDVDGEIVVRSGKVGGVKANQQAREKGADQ